MKKKLIILFFQIGVNVIGLPEFKSHNITPIKYLKLKSKYHN
jgi:hypothetical protein